MGGTSKVGENEEVRINSNQAQGDCGKRSSSCCKMNSGVWLYLSCLAQKIDAAILPVLEISEFVLFTCWTTCGESLWTYEGPSIARDKKWNYDKIVWASLVRKLTSVVVFSSGIHFVGPPCDCADGINLFYAAKLNKYVTHLCFRICSYLPATSIFKIF